MKNSLRDVLVYIFMHYPHPNELSKARVVKMVYLADWRNSIQHGQQITSIKWLFNHYGPYVNEIIEIARKDEDFDIVLLQNAYGAPKELIRLKPAANIKGVLADDAVESIDHVIKMTSKLFWDDFMALVYSTYPIMTQRRYSTLNLPELANAYKSLSQPGAAS